MKRVPLMRLADVCDINPRMPRDHGLADDAIVSFVPMAAVDEVTGTIATPQIRPFAEVRKGFTSFRDGDVLFAKITPCMENGKAALAQGLAGGVGFGSTEFHVLRASGMVLPAWLRYFVRRQAFRREAKRNFTGTAGQQRVPMAFLSNAQLPVPPLEEQRRIVDLLSRAEGIVRLRREAQAKAQAIIPALFLDMFGDPAANPKGWLVRPLGELLARSIRNGVSPSRTGTHKGRVLTLSAITRGTFDATAVKDAMFAAPLGESNQVSEEDFLVCRGNGNRELVGVGCFPDGDMRGVAFPDTAIAVRPRVSLLGRRFLAVQWQTRAVRQQVEKIAKTTNGTYKINQTGLSGVKLILPPEVAQQTFDERVRLLESITRQQAQALFRAEATFRALLARAFNSGLAASTPTRETAVA